MDWSFLTGLPPHLQIYVVLAVGPFVIYLWARKFMSGTGSAPVRTESVKVVTADTVAMQELTHAIEAMHVVMLELQAVLKHTLDARKELVQAMRENTEMGSRMRDSISEARADIRDLTRELSRRH